MTAIIGYADRMAELDDEAFEICEYGSQPSEAELQRLFPFDGKADQ
jgi:hypothetical protein